jgi:spore maturation protein CgeB
VTGISSLLFAGFLWPGSTCVPRMDALREGGLRVRAFDTTPVYGSSHRLVNSLSHRLYATPRVARWNRALLRFAEEQHCDAAWIEKGDWIWPSTLRALRRHVRYLVHYNTDDIHGRQTWFWLHRRGLRFYDLCLTTNRFNIAELRGRHGARVFRAGMGYEQGYHDAPPAPGGASAPDVVFAGHWEPHTENYVNALHDAGLRVDVWGPHWARARNPRWRRALFLGRESYTRTIVSAKMALCSLSRRNRNESTGRTFEIPALGAFLLAPHTAEHAYLFRDGVEAALFRDERELVEKALYYATRDDERLRVAAEGRRRCMALGLSWGDHIAREWPLAERLLLGGDPVFTPADDAPFWPGFRDGTVWIERAQEAR